MTLERVPPKTPAIDAVEGLGPKGKAAGGILRRLRDWWERRGRKRDQAYIDRTYHDALRDKPRVGEGDK